MSSDDLSEDANGSADGEGVWSTDIEQSFQEALHMYPPCGRRKIIINDDAGGKMYGRNELIARYIKVRTGKTRSRKQVSSHIQVLARRKAKEATSRVSSSTTPTAATTTPTTHLPNTIHSNNNNNSNSSNHNHINSTSGINLNINTTTTTTTNSNNNIGNINSNNINNNNIHHNLNHHIANLNHNLNNNNIVNVCNNTIINSNNNAINTISTNHINNSNNIKLEVSGNTLVNTPIILTSYDNSGIASQKLRLVEFSAFVNQTKISQNDNGNSIYPHHLSNLQNGLHHHHYYHHQPISPLPSNHHLHLNMHHRQSSFDNDHHFLIHISQRRQAILNDKVDIAQIQDKFPEKGGLRDLYNQGPKDAFFLVKCWADFNDNELDDQNSFYGFSSHFESNEEMTLCCETKVCSFGNVTAELAHKQKPIFANGRYHYQSHQPMCDYMTIFLNKLRHLPHIKLMNDVLENFTILKVITDENTKETLLCIAFIFEVSEKHGATHNIYKLKGM